MGGRGGGGRIDLCKYFFLTGQWFFFFTLKALQNFLIFQIFHPLPPQNSYSPPLIKDDG